MKPYENLSLEDMEGEVWKDAVGYEGLYQVSNLGRVKTVAREQIYRNGQRHHVTEKIKKPFLDKRGKNGYLSISVNGKRCWVHRWVCIAFVENPDKLNEVNHKDGDSTNNNVDNLEWCTHAENMEHARVNKLFRMRPIFQYDKTGIFIRSWESLIDASKSLGILSSDLVRSCKNKRAVCHGFYFRYKKCDKITIPQKEYRHVLKFSLNGEFIAEYTRVKEAAENNNTTENNIVCCCLGRVRQCKGFIYKYKN